MTGKPRAVVVVPTIREECMQQFLAAWEPEFGGVEMIVVEDHPEPSFELRTDALVEHVSWRDIDDQLGELSWIVPRRTDCVRSFGYWLAWQRQPDLIVTLDDDCLPTPQTGPIGFLEQHWQRLEAGGEHDAWVSTTDGTIPRGVPYHERGRRQPCVINHGLWENVIDFDAVTQLSQVRQSGPVTFVERTVPRGSFYPMCGMNLAFRPQIVPAMYFMLMGRDWGVDRFGDIWCGLFSKRICDHLGLAVNSGGPHVHHARASNVWANLRKEALGMERNETLWRLVDDTVLTERSVRGCYAELAAAVGEAAGQGRDGYLVSLARAMDAWAELFRDVPIPSATSRSWGATPSEPQPARSQA